jgi:hypothetical protein
MNLAIFKASVLKNSNKIKLLNNFYTTKIHAIGKIRTTKYNIRKMRREFKHIQWYKRLYWKFSAGRNLFSKYLIACILAKNFRPILLVGHFRRQRRKLWFYRRWIKYLRLNRKRKGLRALPRMRFPISKRVGFYNGLHFISSIRYFDKKLYVENTMSDDIYREYDIYREDRYEDLIEDELQVAKSFIVLFKDIVMMNWQFRYSFYRALRLQERFNDNYVRRKTIQIGKLSNSWKLSKLMKKLFFINNVGDVFDLYGSIKKRRHVTLFKNKKIILPYKNKKITSFNAVFLSKFNWLLGTDWYKIYFIIMKLLLVESKSDMYSNIDSVTLFHFLRYLGIYHRWISFFVFRMRKKLWRIYYYKFRKKWRREIYILFLKVYKKLCFIRYYIKVLLSVYFGFLENNIDSYKKNNFRNVCVYLDGEKFGDTLMLFFDELHNVFLFDNLNTFGFKDLWESIRDTKFGKITFTRNSFLALRILKKMSLIRSDLEDYNVEEPFKLK